MSYLGLYFISSSLTCHVYFMLYSIVSLKCFIFCLSFIFSFILYPSCIFILVHIFFSFPRSFWPLCLFVSKRERVHQRVLSFLYDSCAHSKGEKFYFLCTFLGGERLSKDAYTKGEKTFIIKKTMFCLFSWLLYGALSYVQYLCFVVFIASCLCVGHAYILMLLCFIGCMFG